MPNIAELYKKYNDGDFISSSNLIKMHTHFTQLGDLAMSSGPVFKLAGLEARAVAENVKCVLDSRGVDIPTVIEPTKWYLVSEHGAESGPFETYEAAKEENESVNYTPMYGQQVIDTFGEGEEW